MKNIFLLVFLTSNFFFGQEITFDYYVETSVETYSINRKGNKKKKIFSHDSQFFVDSETNQTFRTSKSGNKSIVSLEVPEINLLHYFFIYEHPNRFSPVYSSSFKNESANKTNFYFNYDKQAKLLNLDQLDNQNYLAEIWGIGDSEIPQDFKMKVTLDNSGFQTSGVLYEQTYLNIVQEKIKNEFLQDECCFFIKETFIENKKRKRQYHFKVNRLVKTNVKLKIPEKLNFKE